MKNILFLLALFAASPAVGQTAYGEKTTAEGAIPANELAAKMKGVDSLAVKVKGTVTSVCQRQGCWLMVDIGGGKMMRVKFRDHAFFVPKNISGSTVVVDGYAYTTTTNVARLRHFAEDAGKSQAEIEAITEPETNLVFEARGVLVM